ncbi:MAG: tsaE [Bacteroidota bacterium]|jgi:tRNA threonylcarbamoyladenosine biosynthesis protein TsaE|nr:tsaE [Bacteroidota bacterium]
MKTLKLDISNLDDHRKAVRRLLEFAGDERIFTFDAPMGSGKTTFIKSLCLELSVTDTMSSPTYSIVNEYYTSSRNKLFHFDLYRLKNPEELFELGFDEYLSSGNYVFIEWPELAIGFLSSFVRIIISTENNNRYLHAEMFTSR